MRRKCSSIALFVLLLCLISQCTQSATNQKHYYAYDAVLDKHGVITPWYTQLNGPCDYRIRIAAETLKRYPWTGLSKAPAQYPEYMWNGHWSITPEGVISVPPFNDWNNGDLGQRAAYVLTGLADYYRYTGDAAAIAHLTWQADFLLDYCQTDDKHPWPGCLISVPYKGKPYGKADPAGMIQLDIVAEVGIGMLKAYQITGDMRYFDAAKHWADLLAQHRDSTNGLPPWPRYANPQSAPWPSFGMTGGVAYMLYFFDELIRLGYTGKDNAIVTARDAGRVYLRDVLLPKWLANETWGFNYWDCTANWQQLGPTEFAARYILDNPDVFPNWRNDVRNIISLFLNRTSANPKQRGEVYSGAWAYPESFGCCLRSLWYGPLMMAPVFAQYGVQADSEWGKELGRRQQILSSYDIHETGVSEDNIDGGQIVNGSWFKIAHPFGLKYMLNTIAWMPEIMGANRENHIVRSSAVINTVCYGRGRIAYSTFDAPANTTDILRMAFKPESVMADNKPLSELKNLGSNGYIINPLSNGDYILTIRHDGARSILIGGNDPQEIADDNKLTYDGSWNTSTDNNDLDGHVHITAKGGDSAEWTFNGNQVKLLGRANPNGGLADIYIDGVKQLAGVDCWNPSPRFQQVLYYKNGLSNGPHTLKITARGAGNPYSKGAEINIDAVEWSSASGNTSFGEGGGPKGTQRMIFGYPWREDYIDSAGNKWRPGTEFAIHKSFYFDTVNSSWWTEPVPRAITNTPDSELYRYGVHAPDFSVNVTVGPGTYYARLKFALTRGLDSKKNCITVSINGRKVADKMDVAATAKGEYKAVDLVFNDISPENGVIDIRFAGGAAADGTNGEAFVQAVEVGPGDGGRGAKVVSEAQ